MAANYLCVAVGALHTRLIKEIIFRGPLRGRIRYCSFWVPDAESRPPFSRQLTLIGPTLVI